MVRQRAAPTALRPAPCRRRYEGRTSRSVRAAPSPASTATEPRSRYEGRTSRSVRGLHRLRCQPQQVQAATRDGPVGPSEFQGHPQRNLQPPAATRDGPVGPSESCLRSGTTTTQSDAATRDGPVGPSERHERAHGDLLDVRRYEGRTSRSVRAAGERERGRGGPSCRYEGRTSRSVRDFWVSPRRCGGTPPLRGTDQ